MTNREMLITEILSLSDTSIIDRFLTEIHKIKLSNFKINKAAKTIRKSKNQDRNNNFIRNFLKDMPPYDEERSKKDWAEIKKSLDNI